MRRIFHYLKPYALLAVVSPLLMIGEVAADLCLPKLMSVIVDYGINASGDVSESVLGSTVMRIVFGEGSYTSMQVIITFGVLMLLVVLVGGFFGVFFPRRQEFDHRRGGSTHLATYRGRGG